MAVALAYLEEPLSAGGRRSPALRHAANLPTNITPTNIA